MIEEIKELEKIAKQLDPPSSRRMQWANMVVAHSDKYLDDLDQEKAYFKNQDDGAGILDYGISEKPAEMGSLLNGFESHIQNDGINAASGGHLGYIPGGGLFPAALGDYLAAVTNKFASIFYPAPGAVRLENLLIRWMCRLMGFLDSAAGNLTSGGSISNLIAIVTAREAAQVRAKDFHRLVVYISTEAHHSLSKALKIAGLGEAHLRLIPLDDELRMKTHTLDETIKKDKSKGLIPFFINGSFGTTNTGTIDPIDELANVAETHKIWYHVDAAYGGFFKLLPEMAKKFAGIERADSITLDPHKSLFLPFGTGAVLIKNVRALKEAHQYTADYLQDLVSSEEEINPTDVSPELSKHFRGMRMWLPLKLFGLKPFRAALKEKMLLTQYFQKEIQKIAGFQVGAPPDLSVALFRYVSDQANPNTVNERLLESIKEDGRIFLSSTMINGQFWIRVAVLVFRSHIKQVDLLLTIIKEKIKDLEFRPQDKIN